jgi:hypothetical protein
MANLVSLVLVASALGFLPLLHVPSTCSCALVPACQHRILVSAGISVRSCLCHFNERFNSRSRRGNTTSRSNLASIASAKLLCNINPLGCCLSKCLQRCLQ